jgi:hypothetical protein
MGKDESRALAYNCEESIMLGISLFVILLIALVAAVPTWTYSKTWGYYPTGGIGLILAVEVLLMFKGRI